MKLRLHGLSIRYDQDPAAALRRVISEKLGRHSTSLTSFSVVRRSIDARKHPVQLVYSVDVDLSAELQLKDALPPPEPPDLTVATGSESLLRRPLVVGAGPAGLFAGYLLARHGFRPLIIDRGGNIHARNKAMAEFRATRNPDPECNALFGLGGAGTFSDGKLTTSVTHPWIGAALQILVDCGAPEEILVNAKPHIGTDVLQGVVMTLAERITAMGGEIRTGVRLDRIHTRGGRIVGADTSEGSIETGILVAAVGHSARDTLKMFHGSGVSIVPKPFQIGVRVEHPQAWVDQRQFGKAAGHPALGASEYKLTTRVDGIPVFSFCMCPGGWTLPTINEPEQLCVNGMSNHARDTEFSCSGIVATVTPEMSGATDFDTALNLVRSVERTAFIAGGSNYSAPAQDLLSFIKVNKNIDLKRTSYDFGLTPFQIEKVLPRFIVDPIQRAFAAFDRAMPGYIHPDAMVIAPEARASSPVRIERDRETRESLNIKGFFPVGEGAGHAGGIMSAALDGMHAARHIIERHRPPSEQ